MESFRLDVIDILQVNSTVEGNRMKSLKGLLQGVVVFALSLVVLMLATYLMGYHRGWGYQLFNGLMMLEMCVMSALIAALLWGARRRHRSRGRRSAARRGLAAK